MYHDGMTPPHRSHVVLAENGIYRTPKEEAIWSTEMDSLDNSCDDLEFLWTALTIPLKW